MATTKQELVAQKILENPGMSISQAMKEIGYSENTAHNPSDLTKSKGWKELMEEVLPDDLLADKHLELLNKKEFIAIGKPGEREVLETGEIDANAVSKGLDMAYKLKGKYAEQRMRIIDETEEMTDEELDIEIERLESKRNRAV